MSKKTTLILFVLITIFCLSSDTLSDTNLVLTTEDDPNLILVSSNAILREALCNYSYGYEKVFNPCYPSLSYNSYLKLDSSETIGEAFTMEPLGVDSFDSFYVPAGYTF